MRKKKKKLKKALKNEAKRLAKLNQKQILREKEGSKEKAYDENHEHELLMGELKKSKNTLREHFENVKHFKEMLDQLT